MSVKKWIIRDTGLGRLGNSYFVLKRNAVERAKQLLLSGEKKTVHIARFSETKYERGEKDMYINIETWELVNGIPKRVRRS